MRVNKFTFIKCASLFAAVLLFSCNRGKEEGAEQTVPAVDTTTIRSDSNQTVSYVLPSPLQIASIFKKSGLKYIEGVANPASNSSKYTTATSKNLNLGVYSSDLCYSVVNKQNQTAINYIKTLKQLVNELGMSSVFETNNLSSRFEKNLNNEDSLAYIISELQMETDMYLQDNEKKYLSTIVFAGAWVESMYIGSKVYEKGKNSPVSEKISEQMSILNNMIKVLSSHETSESEYATLLNDLRSVQSTYDSFASVKKYNEDKAAGNEQGSVNLTDEEIARLSTQIAEIRNKIVSA